MIEARFLRRKKDGKPGQTAMVKGLAVGWLAAGALLATSACTALEDGGDTYQKVTGGADWSCLKTPVPAPPMTHEMVPYTVPVIDWVTNERPVGLKIKVCNPIDFCTTPLQSYDANQVISMSSGRNVTLPLPTDTSIFLSFEADGAIPLWFFFDGLVQRGMVAGTLRTIAATVVMNIAVRIGAGRVSFDKGLVVFRGHDCSGAIASQTTFSIDPEPTTSVIDPMYPIIPFSLNNGDVNLIKMPTGEEGIAGFANVPVGPVLPGMMRPLAGQATGTGRIPDGSPYGLPNDMVFGTNTLPVVAGIDTVVEVRAGR